MMMQSLITAGQRLAEALAEENEALAQLDLLRAAKLADAKIRASEAFSAAHVAVHRTGARIADEIQREETERLSLRLKDLSDENRRLLERAIALQAKVIETIAGAALPYAQPVTYTTGGRRAPLRPVPFLSIGTRA
jgi:chaperonin cofactor prefoldin